MPAHDAGFSLVEVLVSIAILGVVMTSLTAFFVGSLSVTSRQGSRQTAIQLADDAMERVRSLRGAEVFHLRDTKSSDLQWGAPVTGTAPYLGDMVEFTDVSALDDAGWSAPLPTVPDPLIVNNLSFDRNFYVGACWQPVLGGVCGAVNQALSVPFFRVVVAVTWLDRHCTGDICAYVTSTLVSSVAGDPTFNSNAVAQPPAVANPGSLVDEVSAPVSRQLTASGGAPPIAWSASGLPSGLVIDTTGLITGRPTAVGTYSVTASAKDGFAHTGTASFTWTINPGPAISGLAATQADTVNNVISLQPTVSSGTSLYTWTATDLPAGLTISSATGKITGTLTAATRALATVTVTDALKAFHTVNVVWTVAPAAGGLAITAPTTDRAGDPVNTTVTVTPTATGGSALGYVWTATGLPPGLTITPATGVITGKPTLVGPYTVTLGVTDSAANTASFMLSWPIQ